MQVPNPKISENNVPSVTRDGFLGPFPFQERAGICHLSNQERWEITEAELENSVVARFERMAQMNASRLAVKWRDGEWNYATLEQHANRIAASLRGFDRTRPVALLLERKPLAIAAMIGVLKAGGFFVPLDPRNPAERTKHILRNAQAELILTEEATESMAETFGSFRQIRIGRVDESEMAPLPTPADAVAYIIYTSGSTGQPKGVVHTHRNLLYNTRLYSDALAMGAEDRVTQLHTVSFSSALVDIFCPLLNGGAVLVWDFHADGLDQLGEWLEASGATIMNWAPGPFRALAKSLHKKLSSFRVVMLGSEPLLDADVELFRQYFSKKCVLANRLGSTETNHYRMFFVDPLEKQSRTIPAGFAMPGKELKLLDENGGDLPPGELGEIIIRSAYISPGYWRQPELSGERFDPVRTPLLKEGALCFPKEVRTYRTGDLGRLRKDGCLAFHGRADQQVKIRGHRIELGEIEAVLRRCAGIADVAVSPRENGTGTVLEAFLVPSPGVELDERKLRKALREQLPVYMMPARFREVPALPTTATGKLDRRALLNLTNTAELQLGSGAKADSALELEMIRLWETYLGRQGVSVEDDFFVLGGDSLQAVQLLVELSAIAGKPVPNSMILEAPTPRAMARKIGRAGWNANGSCVVPLQPNGDLPPLFLVHNCVSEVFNYLRTARALAPDQPVFGLRAKLAAPGQLALLRIEDMAANFVHEIRSAQLRGPYYLAGSAVGALIAYEMAQQLKAGGEQVAWLGILEAWPHHLPLRFALGKGLCFTWSKFGYHAAQLPLGSAKELARELRRLAAKATWAALGRYRPHISEANRVRKDAPGAAELSRIQHALLAAHWAYRPARYDGQATLIWSEEQQYRLDLPWRELIGKRLKIERVPGAHGSIWRGPNAEVLAETFRRNLAAARSVDELSSGELSQMRG
jgi:amino acid adenylation domain-containing protein